MAMFTHETMRAFVTDALPDAEMAAVERATRVSPTAQALHRAWLARADAGEHSVGGVWRRERLSCPSREQLGGYLLRAGDADVRGYVEFHLRTVCCEWCLANLDDLARRQGESGDGSVSRRRARIQASSAGLLPS